MTRTGDSSTCGGPSKTFSKAGPSASTTTTSPTSSPSTSTSTFGSTTPAHLSSGGTPPPAAIWESAALTPTPPSAPLLPERKALVVNLFNLDAEEKHLTGTIDLEEIGIAPVRFIQTNHMRQYGDRTVNYDRRLPPHSTTLIELHPC